MPATMEAWAVVEHDKPLEKIQLPKPEPTGTEVLVKVTHAGVCHSDLHFWEGFYNLGGGNVFNVGDRTKLPRAPGHEILGVVEKLGPEATGVSVGDSRIVFPWIGCGKCWRCQAEQDNLCSGVTKIFSIDKDGGFASHVVVPDAKYLVEYGDVDPAVACTFGCSAITVLSAIQKVMPLPPDAPIVLVGAGGLGLTAIEMLKALDHANIISLDISPEKRDGAKKAGATAVVDSSRQDTAQEVKAAAGGGVLGVIDFVNTAETASMGIEVLEKGGTMVQVGIIGGELKVFLVGMIFKAASIKFNYVGNLAHLRQVAKFARDGKLKPIPTTTVPWDEANDAMLKLKAGKVAGRMILGHP